VRKYCSSDISHWHYDVSSKSTTMENVSYQQMKRIDTWSLISSPLLLLYGQRVNTAVRCLTDASVNVPVILCPDIVSQCDPSLSLISSDTHTKPLDITWHEKKLANCILIRTKYISKFHNYIFYGSWTWTGLYSVSQKIPPEVIWIFTPRALRS